MAIFMKLTLIDDSTHFYGGPDRGSIDTLIRSEHSHEDLQFIRLGEVPGTTKVDEADENQRLTGATTTLQEEYGASVEAQCLASTDW